MEKAGRSIKNGGGDPTPIYFRLQKAIQKDIENGRWAPGYAIPSERKIAEEIGVSLGTVQKAILNLVSEGYLYRLQGKGTFVSRSTIRRENIRYYRFLSDFKSKEIIFKIKRIDLKIVEGIRKINGLLKIGLNEDLYELKRVFSFRRKPYILSISYLPCKLFQGLDQLPRSQLEKITLYESLEQNFGLPTISNQELFSATIARGETAAILEMEEGSPLVMIEMLAFTYRKRPYEYRVAYCSTEERKLFKMY